MVQFKPGIGAANYFAASDIGISHSLLMDGLWAALLAAAYSLKRRNPRGAWVFFGAALSRWLLDWISHRPDHASESGRTPIPRARLVEFRPCRPHRRGWWAESASAS